MRKLETDKRRTDGFYILILDYAWSLFRDFESYLKLVVGLDKDDFQLILKQIYSKFLFMIYLQAFIPLKIFQRLFTQRVILKVP